MPTMQLVIVRRPLVFAIHDHFFRCISVMVLLLASCASAGHRWDHQALLQLRAGKTTEAEAVALLGKPVSRTNLPNSQRILGFQYVQVAFVVTTQAKMVSLLFESDRLVRIIHATNISDELLDQVERNVPVQSRVEVGGGQPLAQ